MSRPNPTFKPYSQTSANGSFRVNVIYRAIGTPQPDLPRWFNKQLVFQMEEAVSGEVLWTREGDPRTEALSRLHVSDFGWVVLQLADLGGQPPRIVAISPVGRDVLKVGISSHDFPASSRPDLPPAMGEYTLWLDEHLMYTSAGVYWAFDARIRFVHVEERPYFVCRTGWGRYLALDLERAQVLDESDPNNALISHFRHADEAWAIEILQQICDCREDLMSHVKAKNHDQIKLPEPWAKLWRDASLAVLIVRQNRILAAAGLLEKLQDFPDDGPPETIDISPVKNYDFVVSHRFRSEVHLAMLSIGVHPKGGIINVYYGNSDRSCSELFPLSVPTGVENREDLLRSLVPGVGPQDVIFRLGAPEFIQGANRCSENCPRSKNFHFECWDYDQPTDEGTLVSWSLLWRRKKKPEEASLTHDRLLAELLCSDRQECGDDEPKEEPEDRSDAELVSITRFVWTAEYHRERLNFSY